MQALRAIMLVYFIVQTVRCIRKRDGTAPDKLTFSFLGLQFLFQILFVLTFLRSKATGETWLFQISNVFRTLNFFCQNISLILNIY